ncbi:ATP-grasp domain-containing protein [Amycolatopsis coloradensis]|nr:ATP-grasp domain-containing protein [Amycolatopsis coloradensis]
MAEGVYTANLKQALTGSRNAEFVWLCNFEVEDQWATHCVGLPTPKVSATTALVQRMEELGALLAEPGDHLLLGAPIDRDYRRYIEATGLGMPAELVAEGAGGTSAAILSSPGLVRYLRGLADRGAYLMPMGTARDEQKIAETTGLRLAVPDAATFERVNSKIYSRRLAAESGLRVIPGHCCETVAELRTALADEPTPQRPLIVKDAYGVSGKGLLVLASAAKARRLLRMVERRAQATGDDSIHVVVEDFLPKRFDLNYQFTLSRDGAVGLDFVKEALTVQGVHKGHIMPAALTRAQVNDITTAAAVIGARLHADGFFGVVGVDALLGADGHVYPVLEINARLNMSTYQGRVVERYQADDGAALAKHYPVRSRQPVPFTAVMEALGDLARPPTAGAGLLLTCFGTVNAQSGVSTPFDGRLHAVLFAPDRPGLDSLDRRVADALSGLSADGSATAEEAR